LIRLSQFNIPYFVQDEYLVFLAHCSHEMDLSFGNGQFLRDEKNRRAACERGFEIGPAAETFRLAQSDESCGGILGKIILSAGIHPPGRPAELFDKQAGMCYKIDIFPLFLREQRARRSLAASAFLPLRWEKMKTIVYSRYAAVLEADGTPMRMRAAQGLIIQSLDEFLSEHAGEYNGDMRWALARYEQFGDTEAAYGVAETLSNAKNTSVQGLVEAGILDTRGGKVRLLRRDELNIDWDPEKNKRLNAWESVLHLIFALDKNGQEGAAALLGHLGGLTETARNLAYRLYTVCEHKGWTQAALAYNTLVVAWPRPKQLAARQQPGQRKLL